MPKTRNRLNGVIENDTPQHIIDHPVLGHYLELIGDDEKPLVPELISPRTVEKSTETKRSDTKDKE